MKDKVVLITGVSSGIGKAVAAYLHSLDYKLYGGIRTHPGNSKSAYPQVFLDVTDDASVRKAVTSVYEREGRIDVLINSAGFALAGPVEETTVEEVTQQMNTNFLGAFRLCKAVLPIMRVNQSGTIINISSIGGICSLPFQGLYCASKFALEGLTEALRMEVTGFGIRVVLIEPGNFSTMLTRNRKKITNSSKDSVYREKFSRALRIVEKEELGGEHPDVIASLVHRIIKKSSPGLRYTTGPLKEKLIVPLRRILPYSAIEYIIKKHYEQI